MPLAVFLLIKGSFLCVLVIVQVENLETSTLRIKHSDDHECLKGRPTNIFYSKNKPFNC